MNHKTQSVVLSTLLVYLKDLQPQSRPCRGASGPGPAKSILSRPRPEVSMPAFDLSGRTAFVTGASSGLGRHFAQVLAGAGAAVAVSARRVDRVQEVCAALMQGG